ncbi:oxygenase MpaB family protein [Nocardia cerradoensis]|uniref:oxygenase MpaB family protein n=1 Tax=Nocardia cerradoensis TaxID=85688 RepID=UPI003F6A53E2
MRLLALLLGIRKPGAAQFQRWGELLTVGDEPMDQLVEWMYSAGMATARPLFEQALTNGISSLEAPPEPLREFFTRIEQVPPWVDWDQITRGARVLRSGGADGIYIGLDVSLLGGYQFSGFNQTLLRTGALEKGSNTRFAETMRWAMDVCSEHGLEPQGKGYRSTLHVRLIHAFVRRHVAGLPDWQPDTWGLPVNQTDMCSTLIGALVVPVSSSVTLGLVSTPADLTAVAHLARYTGWLIGVQEDLLPMSYRDSVRLLYHSMTALSAPDETTKRLAAPMAEDPLSWRYDRLPQLRRHLARSAHLSITFSVLGPRAMRALGLPAFVLPWYPLVRFPVNMIRSVAARITPGGMERAAIRGDREHAALLRRMDCERAAIGGAAEQLAKTA